MRRGQLQRPRSVGLISGGAVLAGTRTQKDWNLASDLQKRVDRFDRLHGKRVAEWATGHYSGVGETGPVVRTPVFNMTSADSKADSTAWHEKLVLATFLKLRSGSADGEIGIDQVEASFKEMQIPIDEATFARYACELMPEGADSLTREEFLKFHKAVWANQPASVRRFAGDPSAIGEGAPFQGSDAVRSLKTLRRSSSVPSGASLKELRDNENMLRSAFQRSQKTPGYVDKGELPAFFQDVGLDLGVNSDIGCTGSYRLLDFLKNAEMDKDKIALHDLVEMQNKYIATLEAAKSDRTPSKVMRVPIDYEAASQSARDKLRNKKALDDELAKIREAKLQQKVDIVDTFRGLVAEADSALPPDSLGASRTKLMQIVR